MAEKYVRCNSHCKYPAYDKNEIDDLLLNKVYPVGSVYISVSETKPDVLFGGTWEQIKDTFLLSAGDEYTAGSTGGEAKHTLTIDEMPKHEHLPYRSGEGDVWSFTTEWTQNGGKNSWESMNGSFLGSAGNNQPHNNMPPYLTVYMWKRIA